MPSDQHTNPLERNASSDSSAIFGHARQVRGQPTGGACPSHYKLENRTVTQVRSAISLRWNEDQIEELIDLVERGLSAGQIGIQLGRSRNAIVGKVHRLQSRGLCTGLANRSGELSKTEKPSRPVPPKRQSARPSISIAATRGKSVRGGKVNRTRLKKPKEVSTVVAPKDVEPLRLSIMDLTATTCRWPVSGEKADTQFCGLRCDPTVPYCEHHCEVAYSSQEDEAA